MKVSIVNVAPDHNKGACAIAWGLIERVRATGLATSISAFSTSREPISRENYRHIIRAFPDVRLFPSPIFHRSDGLGLRGVTTRRLADRWLYAPYMLATALSVTLPGNSQRIMTDGDSLHELATSDVILNRGGPFLTALGPPPNPTLLSFLWPFIFARKTGIPYGLVGESVGPLANRWARGLVRRASMGAGLLAVREEFSRHVLESAGVPGDRISTMPDNAFWVKPRRSGGLKRLLVGHGLSDGRFLVVTARPWPYGSERYLPELARTIDSLVPSVLERAVLVPHSYHPREPNRDDRGITRQLLQLTRKRDSIVLVGEDLAPDELAGLYQGAGLVIGTRLHSVILALAAGSSVLAIAYLGQKTLGVMRMFGLEGYSLHMSNFTFAKAARLAEKALVEQRSPTQRITDLRNRGDERLLSWFERMRVQA